MKVCPQCNQQNEDSSQICNRCGHQFVSQNYQPQQQYNAQPYDNQLYNNQQYNNQQYNNQQYNNPSYNNQPYDNQQYNNQQPVYTAQPQYQQPQQIYNDNYNNQYNPYQQPNMAAYPNQQQLSPFATPAKSRTKFFIIGGISIIVVAAVVLILILVLGGKKDGYKDWGKALDAYVKAKTEFDVDAALSLIPDKVYDKYDEIYSAMYGSSFKEYIESTVREASDDYRDIYGDDNHFSYTYDPEDVEEMPSSDLSGISSSLSIMGITDMVVNSGVEVKISITVTDSAGTFIRKENDYVELVQIDGKWYSLALIDFM